VEFALLALLGSERLKVLGDFSKTIEFQGKDMALSVWLELTLIWWSAE